MPRSGGGGRERFLGFWFFFPNLFVRVSGCLFRYVWIDLYFMFSGEKWIHGLFLEG